MPITVNRLIYAALVTLLILTGCVRIISTYSIFSQTWDEPAHIAAGLEWLDQGAYTLEPMHPPLARVMTALGVYLQGVRLGSTDSDHPMWELGNAILQSGGQYERNLTLARAGILPFFILASLVVAVWAKEMFGRLGSLLAVFLFTTLPPVLAHAGIAATDMAGTAFLVASFYALSRWMERISPSNTTFLGAVVGLAVLSKFTTLYFFAAGVGLILVSNLPALWKGAAGRHRDSHPIRWIKPAVAAALICALTIWAGYRFSAHSLLDPANQPFEQVDRIVGAGGILHDLAYFALGEIPLPAPEFFSGIYITLLNNQEGRTAYLLGEVSSQGRWYFYPVVFLFKTPLSFLLLSVAGLFYIVREASRKNPEWKQFAIPLIAASAVFLISMGSNMNLGLRQILSVYPLLAVAAGYGVVCLLQSWNGKKYLAPLLAVMLLAWQLFSSYAAHPDYLAYFNELAGEHPEEISVDSDLDWGQDLKRLSQTLQSMDIDEVSIQYYGSQGINLDDFNLPDWSELQPYQKESGWVAISLSSLKFESGPAPNDKFAWLNEYEPVMLVGRSILLYSIP